MTNITKNITTYIHESNESNESNESTNNHISNHNKHNGGSNSDTDYTSSIHHNTKSVVSSSSRDNMSNVVNMDNVNSSKPDEHNLCEDEICKSNQQEKKIDTRRITNIAEKKLTDWIDSLWGFLPEQGTDDWHKIRNISIGGSEISKLRRSPHEIVRRKINIGKGMFEALPMIWGTNFEDLTQLFVSLVCGCIIHNAPGSIPSAEVKGKTFSPDGLGIVEFLDGRILTVLFEFKTLWSRIANQGVIYNNYVDQVYTGMADIPCVDIGIYAESLIRACSWESMLALDCNYNRIYHPKDIPFEDVLASGFVYFYQTPEQKRDLNEIQNPNDKINMLTVLATVRDGLRELNRPDGSESGIITFDWGAHQNKNRFYSLMLSVKRNLVTMKFSPVSTFPDVFDRVKWVTDEQVIIPELKCNSVNALQFLMSSMRGNGNKFLGIMSYKLFDLNLVTAEKEVGYTKQYEELIHDTLDTINKLNSIENGTARYNEYLSIYYSSGGGKRQTEESKMCDIANMFIC